MTMDSEYDVIIVGGGLAGTYTGGLLARKNYKVLILEEHHEVGRPLQCAGLVTPRIFKLLPDLSKDYVLNEVHGAKIHSPCGQELVIDAGGTKALVIDRLIFDQSLAVNAIYSGCDLRLGTKVLSAERSNGSVKLKILQNGEKTSTSCKILVGADGVQGNVARWFGLKGPKVILSGFGAELTGVAQDPGFVEIYLGRSVAPNFFAWVIPKAKEQINGTLPARVGMVCARSKKNAYHYYQQLFKHEVLGQKLKNAQPVQYIAGGVPIGPVLKSFTDNVLLVGDSAGQVKPTSGGGIYTTLICAKHCADAVQLAFETGDLSSKTLKSYHRAWFGELGKELKHGMRLYKVFMHLSDEQLEEGFKLLGDPEILDIISNEGDIDYPSNMTRMLFKRVPQLLKFAKPYLRSFF